MNLFLMILGVVVSMLAYVTIIRPIQGLKDDIMETPSLVPVLTIAFLLLPWTLMFAIWPIWGVWSMPYMFFMSMGAFFSLFFMPNGTLGTLLFWCLLIAIATVSHLIPHPGHEHAW